MGATASTQSSAADALVAAWAIGGQSSGHQPTMSLPKRSRNCIWYPDLQEPLHARGFIRPLTRPPEKSASWESIIIALTIRKSLCFPYTNTSDPVFRALVIIRKWILLLPVGHTSIHQYVKDQITIQMLSRKPRSPTCFDIRRSYRLPQVCMYTYMTIVCPPLPH